MLVIDCVVSRHGATLVNLPRPGTGTLLSHHHHHHLGFVPGLQPDFRRVPLQFAPVKSRTRPRNAELLRVPPPAFAMEAKTCPGIQCELYSSVQFMGFQVMTGVNTPSTRRIFGILRHSDRIEVFTFDNNILCEEAMPIAHLACPPAT